ncbi:MAG: tyrosine-protein phosphatase [Ruminococcus sp.]|nr:tyrosine-protein phosphatase [Ruminococcus sp.]
MTYKSLLSCSFNTRELGGFKTSDGKVTRKGMIWRSDVPAVPSTEDVEKLLSNRITTIIDMRTEAETERVPDVFADITGFDYHHFPITEGSGVPESLEAVPLSYMDIVTAENIPSVWRTMAEAENGVLFHCTAGKDRTGVVSAVILLMCSVDRETIVRDYVISREYNHIRLSAFLASHPEVDRNIVLANEKIMERFIDLFTERYENVENYFCSIGLSAEYAEMIRNKLLTSEVIYE